MTSLLYYTSGTPININRANILNICSHNVFVFYSLLLLVSLHGDYCMYVWSHIYCNKSMDQPGKVANPARSQLNRENEYFPVRGRA